MAQRTLADDLRGMSGEELLVTAAIGNRKMREAVEAELARRTAVVAGRSKRVRPAKAAAEPRLVA